MNYTLDARTLTAMCLCEVCCIEAFSAVNMRAVMSKCILLDFDDTIYNFSESIKYAFFQ